MNCLLVNKKQKSHNLHLKRDIIVEANNSYKFSSLGAVGLSLRKPTTGCEYEMVNEYVQTKLLSSNELGESNIIFIEPKIDSGFPDVVVACFTPDIAKKWTPKRRKINKLDLKVLHYIVSENNIEISNLKRVFPSDFSKSLRRLVDAEIIDYQAGNYTIKSLQEIFAIRRLIAIEAKVKDWQKGIHQALINTWFASESYLLMPNLPNNINLTKEATKFGIGIITAHCSLVQSQLPPHVGKLPKSYVSWLFNEWAWHAWFSD